jgi:hypothetical protein
LIEGLTTSFCVVLDSNSLRVLSFLSDSAVSVSNESLNRRDAETAEITRRKNCYGHTHERACFHFLSRGGYVEYLGRKSRECKTLTLAFQPQGHEHSYRASAEPSTALTIELDDRWIANLSDYSLKLDQPGYFYGGSISWLTTKLHHEFRLLETASTLVIEALALELAAAGWRHILWQ